jgi:hypothetical protein
MFGNSNPPSKLLAAEQLKIETQTLLWTVHPKSIAKKLAVGIFGIAILQSSHSLRI